VEKTFKSRFCNYYKCPEDQFEQLALLKVLHRRSLVIAWIILKVAPSFFATDYRILRQIGSVSSRNNLAAEARDVRHDYVRFNDYGFFRRFLNLRISGQRLLALANSVWSA
jgi:hypothetical protein